MFITIFRDLRFCTLDYRIGKGEPVKSVIGEGDPVKSVTKAPYRVPIGFSPSIRLWIRCSSNTSYHHRGAIYPPLHFLLIYPKMQRQTRLAMPNSIGILHICDDLPRKNRACRVACRGVPAN